MKDPGEPARHTDARPLTITIHCQVYWPDNSAVSQMITAVAEDTAAAGHNVTVVTHVRGYNLGETFPRREQHKGVSILRVGGAHWNRHRTWSRLANYLSFILFSGFRLLLQPRPDCLLITSVPPFSLLPAGLLRLLRGVPFVYIIEDLYPEIAIECGLMRRTGWLTRCVLRVFGVLMRPAGAIIVLGEHMKRRLLDSHPGLRKSRIHCIDNWQDGKILFPLDKAAGGAPVCFQYSGNLGQAHDANTLLQAMDGLKDRTDLRFEFIGRGQKRPGLEKEVAARGIANCRFEDYVPMEQLNASLNRADVCLVTLRTGFEGLIVPSKIYGIMAVGKPVLFVGAPTGEIPDLIRRWSLGWVVTEGDDQGLSAAILEAATRPDLRKTYGQNARRAFEKHYNRPLATVCYQSVMEMAARGGQSGKSP